MPRPVTKYARSGDVHVAYQTVGDGPIDLVFIDQWWSNVDAQWDLPPLARTLDRLASFSRLILLDKRGTGLSDPVPLGGLPTLEEWMDDIRAVLDAVGSERTALLGGIGAGYLAILFAATYPERTSALVLVDGYARLLGADDYLPSLPRSFPTQEGEAIRAGWGTGVLLERLAPAEAQDPAVRQAFAAYERQSASPGTASAMLRMLYEGDVRRVLSAIRVPTLVIGHAQSARVPIEHTRYLAEHIEGATYIELPGAENLPWAGDPGPLLAQVQEFLTGIRPREESDRVLATILFTDIVQSTQRLAELGDERWRLLLGAHDRAVREELQRFRGREIETTGDGFLAIFDGPARAVRCAAAIRDAMRPLVLEIRAGLHTGEVALVDDQVRGIAVHIAARVAALAAPSEILVSATVKDLVIGSGISFQDRGLHVLKGVPDEWRVYRAEP
ncbi:MAG TPA: adenylate/guanylate cyclase domain-containing protein [Candidatus Limnocylindrales bacterium]|nr:adenylate/guanylate cyclase domain-containing protein [Candidatus Limnocylindrales bacterium]